MIGENYLTLADAETRPLEDFLDAFEMMVVKADAGDLSRTNPTRLIGRSTVQMTHEQLALLAAHSRQAAI